MASNLRVDSIVPTTSGNVSIGTATGGVTIPGDLGIAGVLTYEDVTNIDSVGVITARSGINVTSGSIGINTTGGNEKLNTFGAIRSSGSSANFNAGLEGTLLDYDIANRVSRVGHVNGASGSARSLAFLTGGGERLRVGPAGQLGIGGANYGTSGQVLTSQGSGSAVQWATSSSGLSDFDSWYLTADKTSNGDITSDLSRVALSGAAAQIGSGMSESSGIFTFPNTGKYLIIFTGAFNLAGNDTAGLRVDVTVDNNTYNQVSQVNGGQSHYSGGTANSTSTATGFYFLDVTDTSNVKVKFETSSIGSNGALKGNSTYVRTGFIFARIGDT